MMPLCILDESPLLHKFHEFLFSIEADPYSILHSKIYDNIGSEYDVLTRSLSFIVLLQITPHSMDKWYLDFLLSSLTLKPPTSADGFIKYI